jgi:hypothetical protein
MGPVVTATASISGRSLPVANVLPVGVIHERIVVINVYIIVSSPTAVAAPSPAATPSRSNGHSNAE